MKPGKKLEAWRIVRNLTAGEMATHLGISRAHWYNLVKGPPKGCLAGRNLAVKIEELSAKDFEYPIRVGDWQS